MGYTDSIFICWKKEQKVFNKNLAILRQKPGKEPVHDLRVAIKKLRAALKLYFLISEKPFPENFLKDTEQLFSILGKQRDIEICLEIIDTFQKDSGEKYPELKNYFRSVLAVTYKWTKNAIGKYRKKELENLVLLVKLEKSETGEDEVKNKISDIINLHLAGCRDLFNKPHKLRQSLKEIYYWIKMFPESLYNGAEPEKELNPLLEDFGNWQNLTVFKTKLKHFRKDYLPKTFPEYYLIKMLEVMVKEKMDGLLKASINNTKILLRKAKSLEKEIP